MATTLTKSEQPIINLVDAQFFWNNNSSLSNAKQTVDRNEDKSFSTSKLNCSIKKGEFVVFFGQYPTYFDKIVKLLSF